MLKVGLTGGIGSGKSSVSELFSKWGAYIFDADSVAKEILNNNETAQGEMIAEFGTDILDGSGNIDKQKLARIAFQDEKDNFSCEYSCVLYGFFANRIFSRKDPRQ